MLGVIGFLSTTFLFSPIINFFIFIFVLFRCFHLKMHQIRIEKKQFLAVLIMWVAASLSVLNFWLVEPASSNMEKSILGEFPYLTMLIISLAVSFFAIYEDLKWVFILILVEIFIGLLEYGYGVRSFFVASAGETLVGETDLLYYNRVFGLSLNSSVFAFKILVAYVIWSSGVLRFPPKFNKFIIAVLVIGLVISFSRTVLFSVVVSFAIVHYKYILKDNRVRVVVGIFLALSIVNVDYIIEQVGRGRSSDYSGRDFVYTYYYNFIVDNPLFGNSGVKLWYELSNKLYHAHNSYLQLFSSNGIVIATIFLVGYLLLFKGYVFKLLLPFLIYSLLQYGLWWGFVFHDIIIFSIFFVVYREQNNEC
tara:strand:+ start:1049 stop:2140 length:1092 start_codon:yes stop_codon:yes gene_type:complete